jgi:integrase
VGQYKIGYPSRAKTEYIYSKTRKEAAAKLAEAVVERDSGLVFDCGSLTIEDYLDRWREAIRGPSGSGRGSGRRWT